MVNRIYNYKDNKLNKKFVGNYNKVLFTTGPWLFTEIVGEWCCNNLNKFILYDKGLYNNNLSYDGTNGKYHINEKKKNYYGNNNEDLVLL